MQEFQRVSWKRFEKEQFSEILYCFMMTSLSIMMG